MGFCILGGKENYLRKIISDKLTSLGETISIGATAATFASAIQDIYDDRYTAGQDSLKTSRTLTLPAEATGSSYDITDNWYTTVNASAVYSAGVSATKVGTATQAAVRSGYTFTNSSSVGLSGTMATLTSSNFSGSHSTTTAGTQSTYTVKSTSAGYVANSTTVNSLTSGTSSTLATTAATGTVTISCTPGYYHKISVNQTNAYNAGTSYGRSLVASSATTIASGSISLDASVPKDTNTATVSTSRSCIVILQSGTYNSYGIWMRSGTTVTKIAGASGNSCTATSSAITITYCNSSYATGNYWVISMD